MRYTVLTLFPALIQPWTREGILGRAVARGLVELELRDVRSFATDRHRTVDGAPYGGGAGMVIRADVLERALAGVGAQETILLSPAGRQLDQRLAEELSRRSHLAVLCGRYEGFDARVESLATREVSVGDFVMMGGEAAAVCLIEATARLIPGVLGDEDSHRADSFSSGLLDYPQYTRPPEWRGMNVPDVLTSGDHAAVARWRRREALRRTRERRPELLAAAELDAEDLRTLLELGATDDELRGWGHEPPSVLRPRRRR